VDLRRETDIEQLRRVAIAQQIQIEQLLRVLRAKCDELAALKGSETELQQTLSLVENLTRQADTVAAQLDTLPKTSGGADKPRKDRSRSGPTEQPSLPVVEQTFELDAADRTCPSCGGALAPMKGQFEASEMIDVVEVIRGGGTVGWLLRVQHVDHRDPHPRRRRGHADHHAEQWAQCRGQRQHPHRAGSRVRGRQRLLHRLRVHGDGGEQHQGKPRCVA
jgi:hypothetical protein